VLLAIEALGVAVLAGNDWSMIVAGPLQWAGAEREVEAAVAASGVAGRVKFYGRYSTEEQIDFLNDASVLLHLQDNDASPTVPLEAMACEVPVVGIHSGGMPELVGTDAGVLLRVSQGWDQYFYPSVSQICDGLSTALAHREEMGRAGRKAVEAKFSSEKFLSAHAEIFQSVLLERKK
jgi:glycosyltransferase involved in cell wall biosynthesis